MSRSDLPEDPLDGAVRSALAELSPRESDAAFWRRLQHQLPRSHGRLAAFRFALRAGLLCAAIAAVATLTSTPHAGLPVPSTRSRIVQLAAEHSGEAMVISINQRENSALFVVAVGTVADTANVSSALTGDADVAIRAPSAESSPRGSGWLRVDRSL